MQVAGIRELGGPVEVLDVPDPRPLAADEVLIEVKAAGIGNWDEIVRTGGWVVGTSTPMARAPLLIAPASSLAHKPASATWEAAAALPVPALTAEQVLTEALMLSAGEILLVHGAGGITGGLLVQLAVLRGAKVIATCGPGSVARVRQLGAFEVLDYNDPTWPEKARHHHLGSARGRARHRRGERLRAA